MNIGNHLLACLHANFLRDHLIGQAVIHADSIPQLGFVAHGESFKVVEFKERFQLSHPLYFRSRNRPLWPWLILLVSRNISSRIQISEPMMSLRRLPSLQRSRTLVPGCSTYKAKAYDYANKYIKSHLFVNIRAGDILNPIHPSYHPLSPSEISTAVTLSQRPPFFYGQTEDSPYMELIKELFPGSIVLYTSCKYTDFEINRLAENVLIPISTFSWISTWLSCNASKIFYPSKGLYSRIERKDVYLIPLNDARYVKLPTNRLDNYFVEHLS